MKYNGPWSIKNSNNIYKDDFVVLKVDEVIRPDGEPGTYATVALRHGVAILPIDEQGNVYLTKQFRFALQKTSIEVVSGGIEEGEEPLESAKKELKEEAGIVADDWQYLGIVDMDTAIVKCPVHLYFVKRLTFEETDQEGTEDIKILKKTFSEAAQMVYKGEITHSPSCVLLLKAYQLYNDVGKQS